MTFCSLHPRAPAGWTCALCRRALCPDCTGWRSTGQVNRIEVCMPCGGVATRLRAPRSERAPFRASLPGALAWPLSRTGLVTLAAVALVVHLLSLTGAVGGFIGCGVALAYFFQIVRHTAAGHDEVPAPADFRGLFDDVVSPIVRSLFASMWLVFPLLAWLLLGSRSPLRERALDASILAAPIPLLLLLCGAFLYPMAIIAGALDCPLTTLLNPLAIIGLSLQLGSDYWLCASFSLGCALAGASCMGLCDLVFDRVPLPFNGFISAAILLYFPFVSFRALGLLVRARGDSLGYGSSDAYRVFVLDADPRHEVKPPEERPELRAQAEPIELGAASALPLQLQPPAEGAAELGAPAPLLPLDEQRRYYESVPSAELPAAPDPLFPSRLAQRMAASDLDGARAVLQECAGAVPAGTLSAQSWLALSRSCAEQAARADGAERKALAELAVTACKRGVEVAPEGALAPKTWLAAARLCDELLGDRARSDRLLAELSRRFPETPEGAFAARRLAAPA